MYGAVQVACEGNGAIAIAADGPVQVKLTSARRQLSWADGETRGFGLDADRRLPHLRGQACIALRG